MSCSPHGFVCNPAADPCSPRQPLCSLPSLELPGFHQDITPSVQLRVLRSMGCREIACHGRGLLPQQRRCRPRPLFRGSFNIKTGRILEEALAHTAKESTMHKRETRSRTSSCNQPLLPCHLQGPRTAARCNQDCMKWEPGIAPLKWSSRPKKPGKSLGNSFNASGHRRALNAQPPQMNLGRKKPSSRDAVPGQLRLPKQQLSCLVGTSSQGEHR